MKNRFKINKNCFLALLLIAIFVISTVAAFAPTALAQSDITQPRTTAGYVDVAPHLIGVGQQLTVNLWVVPLPQDYATAPFNNGFTGVSVTLTRPDGTKDTFTPTSPSGTYAAGVTDPLGTLYFYYSPNMVGNWSVMFTMPAQNLTNPTGTTQWKSCTSAPAYFTVQTDSVNAGLLNGYPYAQLPGPNTYWTYPISPNNREWSAISGDWLSTTRLQMYGSAPNTGHILWTQQWNMGGLVGGSFGSLSYEPPNYIYPPAAVILNGKIYQENAPNTAFTCTDLATGKVLWTASGYFTYGVQLAGNPYFQATRTGVTTGVVLEASGGKTPSPYLFGSAGTTWNFYSPVNGAVARSITNVSATSVTFITNTALAFGYTLTGFDTVKEINSINRVWEWNITKVTNNDWYTGLMWTTNASNPAAGQRGPGDGANRPTFAVSADVSTIAYGFGPGDTKAAGFDTTTGKSIWNISLGYASLIGAVVYGTNYFIAYDPTISTFYCYSDLTGQLLWSTADVGTYPWSTKMSLVTTNDKNNFYVGVPDGTIVALSLATGKVVWQTKPIASNEYGTNAVPYWYGIIVAGGNVYAYAGYSIFYELNPIPRFAMLMCVNDTTGTTTFTLNGGIFPAAAAAGYLWCFSEYDQNYYMLGKGQTSTTISAPNNFVEGTTVQIQGSVMDQSPASPNTPAVADSAMSEWMDYLHMQNATLLNNPPKEPGVPVTLTAVDPNNNTVTIGTTTTNSQGYFYYSWKPTTSGAYTITASFAGSGSYWPSSGQTGTLINTAQAATSTSGNTESASGVSDTALYTVGAVLAIVIVIVGIALFILLRKRP